jgi:hypothetical protein
MPARFLLHKIGEALRSILADDGNVQLILGLQNAVLVFHTCLGIPVLIQVNFYEQVAVVLIEG